jgi:isocitrate lyase
MSKLGMPDLGIATLNDMTETAAMIASLNPEVPVIADADTGYGGELSTFNLVLWKELIPYRPAHGWQNSQSVHTRRRCGSPFGRSSAIEALRPSAE